MTQSTWVGGSGGSTDCSMKPGCSATAALIVAWNFANASVPLSCTRVCVTMVTAPAGRLSVIVAVGRRRCDPA